MAEKQIYRKYCKHNANDLFAKSVFKKILKIIPDSIFENNFYFLKVENTKLQNRYYIFNNNTVFSFNLTLNKSTHTLEHTNRVCCEQDSCLIYLIRSNSKIILDNEIIWNDGYTIYSYRIFKTGSEWIVDTPEYLGQNGVKSYCE